MQRTASARVRVILPLIAALLAAIPTSAQSEAPQQQKPSEPVNPLDRWLPEGALKVVGASPDRFNPRVAVRFSLAGAEFDRTKADVTLTFNGARLAPDHLTIRRHLLSADKALAEGANVIALKAYDTIGRPLYYNATLWAGGRTLRVELVNADGTPFRLRATIVGALRDNESVREERSTSRGNVVLYNVPDRKIRIIARGGGGEVGAADVAASQGIAHVKMLKPSIPSDAGRVPVRAQWKTVGRRAARR